MNIERVEELRNYLIQRLAECLPEDLFMAANDEATFAWVDPENDEVILVTLQPAKFEVAS